jgi:hypothetical protein
LTQLKLTSSQTAPALLKSVLKVGSIPRPAHADAIAVAKDLDKMCAAANRAAAIARKGAAATGLKQSSKQHAAAATMCMQQHHKQHVPMGFAAAREKQHFKPYRPSGHATATTFKQNNQSREPAVSDAARTMK